MAQFGLSALSLVAAVFEFGDTQKLAYRGRRAFGKPSVTKGQ